MLVRTQATGHGRHCCWGRERLQRLWEAQPRTSASARRAIALHGTHPKESRTDVRTETCAWMFLEGVLVIAGLGSSREALRQVDG